MAIIVVSGIGRSRNREFAGKAATVCMGHSRRKSENEADKAL